MTTQKEKIALAKKACLITDKAFKYVLDTVRVGESEKDLAQRIDNFIKGQGAKLAFSIIVASGPHSYFVHHKPCRRKIREKEPILLDFGAQFNGFCADLSRTIFIGRPSKYFQDLYNLVLRAQESAIKKLKSDVLARNIDKTARNVIAKQGYIKEFKHTLGHGLGEKVHQLPSVSPLSKEILKKNDIITIEPGIYLKGVGGIRIEDDVLITKDGCIVLTKSVKKFNDIIVK